MQASVNDSHLTNYVGIVLFFIVSWCFLCLLISFVTGWYALTQRFRSQSEPLGETRTAGPFFYSIYMRAWSHYGSVIRLTAADDALYLSVLKVFRIGHPSLRVPWDEIKLTRTRRFFIIYIQFTLGNQEKIPMRISQRMARNLGILDRVPV
jgi:hypothetical protein